MTDLTLRRLLAIASLTLACTAQAGEIYKWIDADGRAHFTDLPPDRSRAKLLNPQVNTYEGPATVWTAKAPDWVAKRGKVTLYGTSWCGVCKEARSWLQEHDIAYQALDIEASPASYKEYKELEGHGVPLIMVGEQRMNGFSAEKMERMLQTAGL